MANFTANPNPYDPTTGEPLASGGRWFYFDIEGHSIALWASLISGLERLYIDNQLVSQKRSFYFTSKHTFGLDGTQYVLTLTVDSPLTGVKSSCAINKQGVRKPIAFQTNKVACSKVFMAFLQGAVYGYCTCSLAFAFFYKVFGL